MKRAVLALLAVFLVFTLRPAEARERPPVKTIGVISDVGNKITWRHIGFMAFSNEETQTEFPGWDVDADITATLEAALKDRYELHTVTFAKGSIAPNERDFFFTLPSPKDTVKANATVADGAQVDAYLVVWPRSFQLYPTNQFVKGLGLVTMSDTARLYAMLSVSLIDARTFKDIDFCWPETKDSDDWRTRRRDELVSDTLDAMTAEQKQAFEQGLKDFLHDGLAYCMADLKLVP